MVRSKPLQKHIFKQVSSDPHPIKVHNLKNAKRLLSRLIYDLQIGKIESKLAKDLCYLLSVYTNIFKENDMDERFKDFKNIEIQIKNSEELKFEGWD